MASGTAAAGAGKERLVGGQSLGNDALRALAAELAEGLAARGLVLGDVERLAPLLVDRFHLAQGRPGDEPGAPREQRRGPRPNGGRGG